MNSTCTEDSSNDRILLPLPLRISPLQAILFINTLQVVALQEGRIKSSAPKPLLGNFKWHMQAAAPSMDSRPKTTQDANFQIHWTLERKILQLPTLQPPLPTQIVSLGRGYGGRLKKKVVSLRILVTFCQNASMMKLRKTLFRNKQIRKVAVAEPAEINNHWFRRHQDFRSRPRYNNNIKTCSWRKIQIQQLHPTIIH